MPKQPDQKFLLRTFKGICALFLLLSLFLGFKNAILSASAETAEPESNQAARDALNILGATGKEAGLNNAASSQTTYQIIGKAINWILGLVGIAFLFFTVYGGITWMTAGGNEEKVGKASKLFQQSFMGMVIVVLAFLFTNFVVFRLLEVIVK